MIALDEDQKRAVELTEGPLRILAGPGSGKTEVLVRRTLHLIKDLGVAPSSILLCTHTDKAAREMVSRLADRMEGDLDDVNLESMYHGTIHSIALRILREYNAGDLAPQPAICDQFEQQYRIFRKWLSLSDMKNNPNLFRIIEFDRKDRQSGGFIPKGAFFIAGDMARLVNRVTEERLSPDELAVLNEPRAQALGILTQKYMAFSKKEGFLDYANILARAADLLAKDTAVLASLRGKIRYIMVDEYQDVNRVQEEILLQLAGPDGNICVVGDDDQSLYRFRGAEIEGLLEFPKRFSSGAAKTIFLSGNYRSHPDIVQLCRAWMKGNEDNFWQANGRTYRIDKPMEARRKGPFPWRGALKLETEKGKAGWAEAVADMVIRLKEKGIITDYNQIAFLFSSVRAKTWSGEAAGMLRYVFEKKHIPVYSPRSGDFFSYDEIKLSLAPMVKLFAKVTADFVDKQTKRRHPKDPLDQILLYYAMIETRLAQELAKTENGDAAMRIHYGAEAIGNGEVSGTFLSYFYKILGFPFLAPLLKDDETATRLAELSRRIAEFERIHGANALMKDNVSNLAAALFYQFFRIGFETDFLGQEQKSDQTLPSGAVPFMTIHQAKGMEFPIVVCASLKDTSYGRQDLVDLIMDITNIRPEFCPHEKAVEFDFYRKYFTAFSRAENLLILTGDTKEHRDISYDFQALMKDLPKLEYNEQTLSSMPVKVMEKAALRKTFAYTSHIAPYLACPRRYRLEKELGFARPEGSSTSKGTLIHQALEWMHNKAKSGRYDEVRPDTMANAVRTLAGGMEQAGRAHFTKEDIEEAGAELDAWAAHFEQRMPQVKEAEYALCLPRGNYMAAGKIDLIIEEDGALDIIDFKTGTPKDVPPDTYVTQLDIYAWLLAKQMKKPIRNLILCYTQDKENPERIIPYSQERSEAAMQLFDRTVENIQNRRFENAACKKDGTLAPLCTSCPFRFACEAQG